MRLLIILILTVSIGTCYPSDFYSDVHYPEILLNLLPSIRISESKNFTKTQDFVSFSESFIRKARRFGEYFDVALSGSVGHVAEAILLNLTRGMADELKTTESRYATMYGAANNLVYHEYHTQFFTKLKNRLADIEWIVGLRGTTTTEAETEFRSQCQIGDNTPNAIGLYLTSIVERCGEPHLSQTADEKLFKLLSSVEYKQHIMSPVDERLFHKRFAAVHHWLSSDEDKSWSIGNFSARNVIFRNKATMLDTFMNDFGITEEYTFCPVKDNFIANFYKRDSVIDFAELLMNHVTVLNYYTAICACTDYFSDYRTYVVHVQKTLQPVYRFIDTWLDDLLTSTWPNTESLLIRDVIQDFTRGRTVSHQNETYKQIMDTVKEKMEHIGHPGYRRQYVVTGQRRVDNESENFGFGCAPSTCAIASTKTVQFVATRAPTDQEKRITSLKKLIGFKNSREPVFISAMDKHLYNYVLPSMAIHQLKHKHGLDLNNFKSHSSYVLLRKSRYFSGCSNIFATGADGDDDSNYLQTLHYHWDGSFPFKDCEDWLVILG